MAGICYGHLRLTSASASGEVLAWCSENTPGAKNRSGLNVVILLEIPPTVCDQLIGSQFSGLWPSGRQLVSNVSLSPFRAGAGITSRLSVFREFGDSGSGIGSWERQEYATKTRSTPAAKRMGQPMNVS